MNTPPALPTNLMYARRHSSCPSCQGPISTGEVIGQFGYRQTYVCAGCTGRALDFLTPADPIETVVEDIRAEARLRRLLDLDLGTVFVIEDDQGFSWTEDEDLPDGTSILAQVRAVDEILLVTRALPLEPYTVAEPPD